MTEYVDAGRGHFLHAAQHRQGKRGGNGNVDYERILNARSEPQNWLTYYGTYDGQRYSELDQITRDNVKRLSPAWVFQAGSVGMHAGATRSSSSPCPWCSRAADRTSVRHG